MMTMMKACVSMPFASLTTQLTHLIGGSNTSHMAQMKAIGDLLIYGAYLTAAVGTIGGGAIGTLQGTGIGAMLGGLMAPFMVIFAYLWIAGGYLAVYLPMVPFLTWIGGIVKWLVAVLEAVIAAPIWAAAHIHPDGDDQVGRGGPGYMLILSVFMRPALMIFGFLAAIILAHPIAGFINYSYMTSAMGAAGTSLYGPVYFMGFTLIYILAMTVMLHTIFGLINYVPDQVLRWIGSAIGVQQIGEDQHTAERIFMGAAHRIQTPSRGPAPGKKPAGNGGEGGGGGGGGGGAGGGGDAGGARGKPANDHVSG